MPGRQDQNKKRKWRKYTRAEENAIIKYICDTKRFNKIKGRRLYQDMERHRITTRPWSSMWEHMRKQIFPNLHTTRYKIRESDRISLLICSGQPHEHINDAYSTQGDIAERDTTSTLQQDPGDVYVIKDEEKENESSQLIEEDHSHLQFADGTTARRTSENLTKEPRPSTSWAVDTESSINDPSLIMQELQSDSPIVIIDDDSLNLSPNTCNKTMETAESQSDLPIVIIDDEPTDLVSNKCNKITDESQLDLPIVIIDDEPLNLVPNKSNKITESAASESDLPIVIIDDEPSNIVPDKSIINI